MTRGRIILIVACGILIPTLVLVGRAEYEAARNWSKAEKALSDADTDEYLYQLQRCAKWNTWFGSHSDAAFQSLIDFADKARTEKRNDEALVALRYARGVVLSTTHFFRFGDEPVNVLEREISELSADVQMSTASVTVNGRTREALISDHQALLERRYGPTPIGSLLIFLSFLSWLLSLIWLIRYAIRKDGSINSGPMMRGSLTSLGLFGLYCCTLVVF